MCQAIKNLKIYIPLENNILNQLRLTFQTKQNIIENWTCFTSMQIFVLSIEVNDTELIYSAFKNILALRISEAWTAMKEHFFMLDHLLGDPFYLINFLFSVIQVLQLQLHMC